MPGFELNITDGVTPCMGCDGYIDTAKDSFLALVLPDKSLDDYLKGEREGRPDGWTYVRGMQAYHVECWDERNLAETQYVVTGVGPSGKAG